MKYFLIWCFLLPISLFANADFDRAEKLFSEGRYKESQSVFEQFLRQHPNSIKALEYMGDIRCIANDWEGAMVFYEKMRDLKPNEANYHYKYGGALGMFAKNCNKFRALGMIPEIRGSFEKAIALNNAHLEARWALIELYLQLPGIAGGSEKKATRYANELLGISPVDGWLAKGRIAEYFERYAKAEISYKKAIEVGSSKTTYQKLADLYKNKMNQPEKAKILLESYKAKG